MGGIMENKMDDLIEGGLLTEMNLRTKAEEEILKESINKLNEDLDKVLKERMKALGISDEEVEKEKDRRFKKFLCERYPPNHPKYSSIEKYWYNDGSEEGLLILTVFHFSPSLRMESRSHFMDTGFEYK